ncbi:hypothetical protein EC973_003630 [Apophysomyces ossiformis]|uniref:F-box domain-containing protein n=1 Tax=Apophysomyces ossiformis TaxID=679940 RepID=A0A8H7BTL2_9FUNG|nr:hypothetical protein EC973_003630 [Apophysomyces ossiformis]
MLIQSLCEKNDVQVSARLCQINPLTLSFTIPTTATAYDFAVQADEGYVEQRFEVPASIKNLSDEQKAECAYSLLISINRSLASGVVDRLAPLLHRDFFSTLPSEISLHILSYVDVVTLTRMSRVSRRWRQLSNDQRLWYRLYVSQGWKYDQKAIDTYLSETSLSSTAKQPSSPDTSEPSSRLHTRNSHDSSQLRPTLAPVPLARTTASMYDPAALPTMPGAPSGRLRPLRRPGDLFFRLRQRRTLQQSQQASTTTSSSSSPSSSSSSSSSSSLQEVVIADVEDGEDSSSSAVNLRLDPVSPTTRSAVTPSSSATPTVSPTTSSSNLIHTNVSRRIAAFPPIPFPQPVSLAAPSSHSRSQPLVSSTIRDSSFGMRSANAPDTRGSVSATHSRRALLIRPTSPSQRQTDHTSRRRSTSRKSLKYDETLQYHYDEETGKRYINWRRLYRNRSLIAKQWRDGKCKMRVFPPNTASADVLDMHAEGIYCIQFDEDKIISGSRDKSIKIWDIRTGECRKTLTGHSASVLCLQFDEHHIISGSSDSTIVQWNIETGRIVKRLLGHSESVLNLQFVKNRIVSCSKDRTVRIWDLETGRQLKTLRGHRAAVNAIQFRGNRIVSASGDHTIKLWDMDTGQCLRTFSSHKRGIACVEFDGERIVSGSSDETIKVWDAATGEDLHTLSGHTNLVRTLQLDSASNKLVSGSYDGSLKVWALDEGRLLFSLSQAIEGRVLNLQFDYARIVCCSNLAKIMIYDFAYGIDTHFLM